jgi:hypothetical protein
MTELSSTAPPTVDKIDLYYNPHAGYFNINGVHAEAKRLAKAFKVQPDAIELIDERPTPELLAKRHQNGEAGRRLSVVKGGDGTIEDWATSAVQYLEETRQHDEPEINVPLLGLSGIGNALNVPTSVNGARYARSLSRLLRSGNAGANLWRPVLCRMPNGEVRTATSILGLLGTATVNAALEERREELRGMNKLARLREEAAETFKQYRELDTRFSVQSDKLKHGLRHRVLAGLDVITMPDIIKVGHVPIQLFSDELFIMETYMPADKAGRLADTAINGARLAAGRPAGKSIALAPGESFTITIDKATGDIPTTIDGDPWTNLQSGETVEFWRSELGIPIICNKKKLAA